MFVIVYNNSVILGPMRWNRYRFENEIQEECEFAATLPDANSAAIVVSEEIKILPIQGTENPVFNSKIETLHGPFWEFTDTVAISSYQVQSLPIDSVKSQLKADCANERWNKEAKGTKSIIQGIEVTIDTSRGNRDIFIQKFLLMSETDTVQWKFPEGWLTLTKSDLGQVVFAGATYVQDQFSWEAAKILEIDNCTSLTDLDSIVIVEPVTNLMPGGV